MLIIYIVDCYAIFTLFDEIENHILTIADQELQDELIYDFEISWDSIFELMAHKLRASKQEQEKQLYIDRMNEFTAFLTIDWAQKILPQEFREGQSSYYGKKGMSVLVGSFLFKMPSESKLLNKKIHYFSRNIVAYMIADKLVTKNYMLAVTSCSQSEIDTLSCGQIILKQFNHDFPYM